MKIFIFATLLINISYAQSQLSQPAWVEHQYGYYSQDKALPEIIADFAAELKLPVMISPAVEGVVNGDFPNMKAIDFLSMLARVYRLMWFYDGAVLHVYSTKEIREEIIALPTDRAVNLESALTEINVLGTHYYWKIIPNRARVELSGPPRFIELAREIIGSDRDLPSGVVSTLPPLDDHVVKIFRLKYIYAAAADKQKTVDIAQLLGRIMNVNYYVTEDNQNIAKTPQDIGKLLGSGLSPDYGAEAKDKAKQTASVAPKSQPQTASPNGAYIIVDTRLNMVIVRDKAERIPLYEAMIEQLDKPLDQIEIEVLILDINEDETEDLGIEWNYVSGDFVYAQGEISSAQMSASEARRFRIKLAALETQGRANISARPSVLTLDNHEAEFSNQQTFYVKLGAQSAESQAVDLVPITYGATLKVKPHVIYENNKAQEILLTLDIQDGRRSADDQGIDGVPSITNSTIKTQAVVGNGKSLLIGGYRVDHQSVGYRRVPLLGYLPVVGLLFRSQNTVNIDSRRYFLISPKLVKSEVVFRSDVEGAEVLQRDDRSYRDRYPIESDEQKLPDPIARLPQNLNTIKRTHSGPP